MEPCTETIGGAAGRAEEAAPSPERATERWNELLERWTRWREQLDSEWNAAFEAFTSPGTDAGRKWLGWALYRLAARVNPEIEDE